MYNNKCLKVLNWNSRSIRNKTTEFFEFLERHEVDIAVVTETWLTSKISIFNGNFSCVRVDRNSEDINRGGGVAIFVRRGIIFTQMDLQTSTIETVGVTVMTDSTPVHLVAAYFPGSCNNTVLNRFKRDIRSLVHFDDPFFVIGDLNARHRSWNCSKMNKAGRLLFNEHENHNFYIHHPQKFTRVPQGRGSPSTLDLVLSNNRISMTVPEVLEELSSDHFPVIFTLNAESPFHSEVQRYRNFRRADWKSYSSFIHRNLDVTSPLISNLNSKNAIDEAINVFTSSLSEAVNVSVPLVTRATQKQELPEHVKLLIRLRNTRRRQYGRTRDPFLKAIVDELNHKIREESAAFKYKNFDRTIWNLTNSSDKFWKISKHLRNTVKYQPPLRKENQLLVSNVAKANVLAETFANSHNNELAGDPGTTAEVNRSIRQIAEINDINDDPGTLCKPSEIKSIIRRLKARKAPGPDGVRNVMLKHLPRKGLVFLCKIFNACLKHVYFPDAWKDATVVAIPKPNKDITLPSNYRPISLLSSLSKILERIILKRLNIHLDRNPIIPNEQFGFKPGHSTCHQLLRVTNNIKEGFSAGKSTGMVLLDVEKAYDSVWQDATVHKLYRSNCPLYLVKIVQSFITNRTFRVSVKGSFSERHNIPFGVPQGSVLSPTLYNVFTSDVVMVDGVIYVFFADDTGFLVTNDDPKIVTIKLQHAQNELEEYQRRWRIKINPSKSQAIFFTRRRAPHRLPSSMIKVGGMPIPWSKEVTYLGLTLDQKLLFDKHINKSIGKTNGLIKSLYPLINRRSCLQLANKLLLFKCIFRPVLSYGSPVWRCCAKTHLKRLQVKQNQVLKMILGLPPYFSTDELHDIAEIERLQCFINRTASTFRTSCLVSSNPLIEALFS